MTWTVDDVTQAGEGGREEGLGTCSSKLDFFIHTQTTTGLHMDKRCFQWVSKFSRTQSRNWNFDHLAALEMFRSATSTLGLSGMTVHQTHHSGASSDRVRFQNCARTAKTRSVEGVQQCHETGQKQSSCGRLPLSVIRSAVATCDCKVEISGVCVVICPTQGLRR